VLQGGGALGAYQAGVYAALAEDGYQPDWIAGISIGAIIAGNPPERRAERPRGSWEVVAEGVAARPYFEGDAVLTVVQLIYREKYYETQAKDYEFLRVSMEEHWWAGVNDTRRTLRHQDLWLRPPDDLAGVRTFDVTRDFD
jgi:predicted acylesterase/phospholipase RssA